ncbi:MAG: hypothetical protein UU08_C0029G0001 [Candidatus Uhrbacteria bacterium GW2011_GWE2_40_58]|nr:MAG: hypothetical protein UT94_C0039G0001 [Candidatus Uhrbacteria bacterium GW2011_GWF2_40_263]KKR66999.1 MAG: hypothetical protein UU08_C0029G0001 [Candidatus Uhrbacteria bacterium GW2011_GWE2_40_58]OGL93814.1 MAG: hypothetical protein A2239_03955 [Candidatus Uhrbacteria bacterium RIFOXYA2_FULL_40_9]OGL97462.1 MAG: hypothetical protein A2332_01195 [Candidatus Uhrbacteria bacterium RIFOXYB2_FULL_41_18]HBK34964.1 hypothetical protein [Candidatus Uhrbacteria bacterium]
MLKKWKKLSTEVKFSNPWWEYRFDHCLYPNGKEGEYHYALTNDSVAVVALTEEGKILLHKQYRYLFERESIEIPTGGIKKGQTPLEAAFAELQEETQFSPSFLKQIGSFEPCNGFVKETCFIFIAKDLQPIQVSSDESEEFEILFWTPEEVEEGIAIGQLTDGIMIAAWHLAKPHILKIIEDTHYG